MLWVLAEIKLFIIMKKVMTIAMLSLGVMAFAQNGRGRLGVNTEAPEVSLDVKEKNDLPETTAQGVIFTNFSTERRSEFTNVKVGTMIFNTDKRCLEMYMGAVGGIHQWNCIPDVSSAIQPMGFDGTYIQGVALNNTNKVKFKIINNSFYPVSNIDFFTAVSIINGSAGITIPAGQNNRVSLASGQEIMLSYTMNGVPEMEPSSQILIDWDFPQHNLLKWGGGMQRYLIKNNM